MDGVTGGMCECWRHTATYLTYWLCVKSHPLDMAARCVALVIYSRASTLTLPCCVRECLINAVSTGSFLCQHGLTSAKSNTIQYCLRGNAGWLYITHWWWKAWINHEFFLHYFHSSGQWAWGTVSRRLTGPRDTPCTQNVPSLNPACDLCWMSYPQCIRSSQLLFSSIRHRRQ